MEKRKFKTDEFKAHYQERLHLLSDFHIPITEEIKNQLYHCENDLAMEKITDRLIATMFERLDKEEKAEREKNRDNRTRLLIKRR